MQRILIVDDERDIAELISDTLIDEGYDTVIKTSGEEALNEIETNPAFDLILLDIMMPGMSGTELCNKVRDKVKCPIIFVSAKSSTVDKLLGFELGAKVTTKATEKVEVSAGYLTRIREDYQDHTLTVDAKYNF